LTPEYTEKLKKAQQALDDCKKEREKAIKSGDKNEASPGEKVPGTTPPKNQTKSDKSIIEQLGDLWNGLSGNGGGKVGKIRQTGPKVWNAAGTSQLPYSVHVENPSSTQPLHTLHVTVQLDSDYDPATFRLGEIDLADLTIHIPDGRTWYQTRIDARATWGVFIDVSARLDLGTGLITWDLTAIDPATSDVSRDPALGLLLPGGNLSKRYGRLYYSVGVKSTIADGTSLDESATIIYDGGTPVITATVSNVVDAAAPVVTIIPNPLPVKSPTSFNLSWTGNDGSGAGVAYYDVYYQVDGGSFALWASGTTSTTVKFKGKAKHAYGFVVVAYDNAGNTSGPPTVAQVTTNT
jgi:hypothetical protein